MHRPHPSSRLRRLIPAVAATAALALLAGCSSAPAPTSSAAHKGKFVIGFEQPLGGQAWRETGLAALQALANRPEYRDKVELKIVRTSDNNAAAQNAAMQNLIAQGVDAILFDPASSSGADAAIKRAQAQGIKVMANGGPYDNPGVYIVSTDWAHAGLTGAKWLLTHLGSNKKVAVLEGLKGVPLNDGSMPGVVKALKDGGAQIVAQSTNGWNEATAQQNMASILRSNPDVGGVYSFLTGGQGVPAAFQSAGLKFVPTVGGSGYNGEACTLMKDAPKGLTGDMVFGQPAIYAKGLEQMVKLLEGQKIPKAQYFPPLEITDQNAKQYCLPNEAANFQLGYDFPGLKISLSEVKKYYQG